jgi:hypothetical protein
MDANELLRSVAAGAIVAAFISTSAAIWSAVRQRRHDRIGREEERIHHKEMKRLEIDHQRHMKEVELESTSARRGTWSSIIGAR